LEQKSFFPPKRTGYILHGVLILILLVLLTVSILQAVVYGQGTGIIIWVLAAIIIIIPLPFLVYRLYSLYRSVYLLSRETLTIRWGLRLERIAVSDIEWVRSAQDLTHPLRLPIFSTAGAILGYQPHPDLGSVEFLAADKRTLLLVASAHQVFSISPRDPVSFVQDFQKIIEMGSITPIPSQSIYPSFVVSQAWNKGTTRVLWTAGLVLNAGILVWVSFLVSRLSEIPLGFISPGIPRNIVPGIQLFLLPIISILFFFISWLAGIYFYRRPPSRTLAFLTWGFSDFSSLLFIFAILFIVTSPGH
jgi:hypothetical protein